MPTGLSGFCPYRGDLFRSLPASRVRVPRICILCGAEAQSSGLNRLVDMAIMRSPRSQRTDEHERKHLPGHFPKEREMLPYKTALFTSAVVGET